MRKIYITIVLCFVAAINIMAQKVLMIQHKDGVVDMASTQLIDSVSFSEDGVLMNIVTADKKTFNMYVADISGMSYSDELPTSATITYDGASAKVMNPFFLYGVKVKLSGANVTIDNANEENELVFELNGSTTNGSLLYNGSYKATFVMNGVSITNTKGAAVDIECGKRILMELKKGTVNTLVDGANGKQKAALYCKGHLEIDKTGTLNVTGNTKHAISAKEYIQLKKSEGKINILGSKSDGIHCGQYFLANGYTVNIDNVDGDGIQAELSGVEPYEEDYKDGSITIQGGKFDIKCKGVGVAGLKADTDITINALKSTPKVTITMTGEESKGLSAGENINVEDPSYCVVTEP